MPDSLELSFLEEVSISQELLRAVRDIGELRGKQLLFERQASQLLEVLRQAAVVHSTESPNRLEGIVAAQERIQELAQGKVRPRNRSEQEIAGYREVLAMIHSSL